jgi:hypothetical protein
MLCIRLFVVRLPLHQVLLLVLLRQLILLQILLLILFLLKVGLVLIHTQLLLEPHLLLRGQFLLLVEHEQIFIAPANVEVQLLLKNPHED